MIKNLAEIQKNSKNAYFSKRFSDALSLVGLEASPKVVATEFNRHFKTNIAQPHTVRKWLVGASKPRGEILILIANWLNMDPKDLVRGPEQNLGTTRKVSFDVEFNDQEVISKYLSLANKDKAVIRTIVDALGDDDL